MSAGIYPKLLQKEVGPWPMNTYAVVSQSGDAFLFDPGGDPADILSMLAGTRLRGVLLTHGHSDHVGALAEVLQVTGAAVYIHPADAGLAGLQDYVPLQDGMALSIGDLRLDAVHTPGHTPGSTCFDLNDGRVIVGDAIFVGGPGRTQTPAAFTTTIDTLRQIVFRWPDETRFYPGHGPSGLIGVERPAFQDFLTRGWPPDTHGDVTWQA